MAAIDNADVMVYKNEADHLREEEANLTFCGNSDINIKSELDDTPIDYNVNEEGTLKETVENFNNIRIKKERVEIEIELEEITAIDNADFIECKNEVDTLWEEETNLTVYDNSEINIKSELDETPIDYNINKEANLKETVENVKIIRIKTEIFENVNNIEIPEENVKNDNYIEIKDYYNIPGDYKDELHSEIPEGSPHCERSALRFASQEALDDHKKWSAERADERTVKIIPRLAHPVVVNGVQFAKSPRVELWKYNAPPEYAGVFGAPSKKPKADSLKVKNSSKTSNEAVYSDANVPELSKRTKRLEEAKEKANCTETIVGDKNNSLLESCQEKFICDECGQQFHKKYSMILHMKTKHSKDIRFKKYAYSSVAKDKLEKSCTVCKKQFSYRSNLITHMRTHTGEKPYSCTVCKKQFSKSSHLNRHMRTHTGEKPFSCTVCKKQFNQSGHLDTHMRTHTGEKPYSCTVCSKQFNRRSNLNKHLRTHTGEKPFSCTVCKKQFLQKSCLNKHMRTHTGEKPYLCTVCKRQFSQSCHLDSHMRRHTGEKPYSCSVCKKQFADSSSWRRHSNKCQ